MKYLWCILLDKILGPQVTSLLDNLIQLSKTRFSRKYFSDYCRKYFLDYCPVYVLSLFRRKYIPPFDQEFFFQKGQFIWCISSSSCKIAKLYYDDWLNFLIEIQYFQFAWHIFCTKCPLFLHCFDKIVLYNGFPVVKIVACILFGKAKWCIMLG
jgi:hypothetical protein